MTARIRGCFPRWTTTVATLLAAIALLPAGCRNESYQVAPVAGRITLDGQPLADAVVVFQPIAHEESAAAGPGSHGRTDQNGRYSLEVIDPPRPGAVVGPHRVTISTATSDGKDGSRPSGERVPRRYRDGTLQFDVPSRGTDRADFDLTTAAKPG